MYDHLLLTRFSIRASGEADVPSKAWLDYRLSLFLTFCLPSVASQAASDFCWFVLCDEQTDPDSLAALSQALDEVPQARIILTAPDRPYLDSILEWVDPALDVLITTRLDSDDAIGPRYVEHTAAYVRSFLKNGTPAQLLCFSRGLKLDTSTGQVYDSLNPNSPILTLFERLGGHGAPTTVLAGNHWYLNHTYPVHHDPSPDPWLIVLHGGNVMNGVRDWDFPVPRGALSAFSICDQHLPTGNYVPAAQPDDREGAAEFRFGLERPAWEVAGMGGGRPPDVNT